MAATAKKTNPELWDTVKARVTEGGKGGKPGEWSARKAQLSVQAYKAEGGAYEGKKAADNHLAEWTRQDWGTKSGEQSLQTGERYLPREARSTLTGAEYDRTSAKKRLDLAKGKQFSAQPKDVAAKTAVPPGRGTRAALLVQAAQRGIKGRSRMKLSELERAVRAYG